MTAGQARASGSVKPVSGGGAVVASGWLGADGAYDQHAKRKLGRAMATSLAMHGGLAAVLIVAFTVVPTDVLQKVDPLKYNVVFLPEPGRGGGGGGSPAPAPKKQLEVPKHQPPAAVPIPVPVPPVDPPPALLAPIQTNTSSLLQASGNSLISLAAWGGGGSGGGIGSGTGNGVGPGTGGCFGGGAYAPGNGVSWPSVVLEVAEARQTRCARSCRAGGTGNRGARERHRGRRVTVARPPVRIDDAAIEAARKWKFLPGMRTASPSRRASA
jgi:protein TonB